MNSSLIQFLNQSHGRIKLSTVVGRYMKLIRKGKEFSGLCPFHQEKTPSFYVNDDKQFYHCFGCGAHGNAYKFFKDYASLSHNEILNELSALSGIAIPKFTGEKAASLVSTQNILGINQKLQLWFQRQLASTAGLKAYEYLQKRGISDSVIKGFALGYAPAVRGQQLAYLKNQGVSQEQLLEAGVVAKRDDGSVYERFQQRIIFPIINKQQQVIAFGGRALSGDQQPKYYNSPETEVFHKQYVFYGEHLLERPIETIIICEGYMDVISMWQYGWKNVLAPLGTSISVNHFRQAWSWAKKIVLCLDGDRAGRLAAFRAAKLALTVIEPEHQLQVVLLPEKYDPDELMRENAELMSSLMQKPLELANFLWQELWDQYSPSSPEQFAALENSLQELLSSIPNQTLRYHYQRFFRERLFSSQSRKKSPSPGNAALLQSTLTARSSLVHWQYKLFALVLEFPHLLQNNEIADDLVSIELVDGPLDKFRNQMFNRFFASSLDTTNQSPLLEGGYNEAGWLDELVSESLFPILCGPNSAYRSGAQADSALLMWQITRKSAELELMKLEQAQLREEDFTRHHALTNEIIKLTGTIQQLKQQLITN